MIFTKYKVQPYSDLGSIVEDNKNRLEINTPEGGLMQ